MHRINSVNKNFIQLFSFNFALETEIDFTSCKIQIRSAYY